MINKQDIINFQHANKDASKLYATTLHRPLNQLINKVLTKYYLSGDDAADAAQELRIVFLTRVMFQDFTNIEKVDGFLYRVFSNHILNQLQAIKRKKTFDSWMHGIAASNERRYLL